MERDGVQCVCVGAALAMDIAAASDAGSATSDNVLPVADEGVLFVSLLRLSAALTSVRLGVAAVVGAASVKYLLPAATAGPSKHPESQPKCGGECSKSHLRESPLRSTSPQAQSRN